MLSRVRLNLGIIFYFMVMALSMGATGSQAAFVISTGNIATPGSKAWGGTSWGDFNNDQCLDALVNSDDGVYLYQQRSAAVGQCDMAFELVRTFTSPSTLLRSVIWGDIDNDGLTDFAVNRHNNIVIYKNTDGTAAGFVAISDFNPGNSEGMAWIDYDADGDLDLLIEDNESFPLEGEHGLRIYNNTQGAFSTDDFLSIAGDAKMNGGYVAVTDFDVDGDVDIYVRRHGDADIPSEADLFVNDGLGGFSPNYDINEITLSSDKGGVVFCDVDNDGDFDLVRTNSGQLGIFEQTGVNSGRFQFNTTTNFVGPFESVACGDVDNDGDVDLFFSGRTPSGSALYLNQGNFEFVKNNLGLASVAIGRGAAFADADLDGDLDLLVNTDGAPSELWENKTDNANYLQIQLTTSGRDAIGASVRLYSCDGEPLSGRQEINGGMGRGSQAAPLAHFGLTDLERAYVARAKFVGGGEVWRTLVPSSMPAYRRVMIDSRDESDHGVHCADTDGDGLVDIVDEDDDNDGVPDSEDAFPFNPNESLDSDGDGVGDNADMDNDNDGTPNDEDAFPLDASENRDSDQDGIGNNADADDDNDGLLDTAEGEGTRDSDGDGVVDTQDLDSDGDGIFDLVESGADAGALDRDNDGRIDGGHPVGMNGVVDGIETSPDSGELDYNQDGVADMPLDTDNDGLADFTDLDADNDGISDVVESGRRDRNRDGRLDVEDAAQPGITPLDTEGDGIADYLDLDTDGDLAQDVVEAGHPDGDQNGLVDGFTDANNDGFDDSLPMLDVIDLPDLDLDGVPDFRDNDDADNDGVPDNVDLDDDNDSIPDVNEGDGSRDSDGDGIADSLDADSDNDGIFDLLEATGIEVVDADNNGRVDDMTDQNGNGLNDSLEIEGLPGQVDYDGDGLADMPVDSDADGVADFRDLDSDNDTALDSVERGGLAKPVDSDGDMWPDYRDLDSDNDGIPDLREVGGIDNNEQFQLDAITDANGDGLDDGVAEAPPVLPDTDEDGVRDYLDLDTDADGVSDLIEAGARDDDENHVLDNMIDNNGNGYDDALELNPLPVPDSDSDGLADYRDPDSTAPSAPAAEAPGVPLNAPIKTGLDGVGGCTVNPNAKFDPMLPMMLVFLTLFAMRKRLNKRAVKMTAVAVIVCGSLLPVTGMTEEDMEAQWYVGAGVGPSEMNPDTNNTGVTVDDGNDKGWKLFVGYDWSEALSIEAYYADLGDVTFSPGGRLDYQDFGIGGVYYFLQDMADKKGLHLFAKIGLGRMRNDSNLEYDRKKDFHLYYGPGIEYRFDNGLALRSDLDLYDYDARLLSVSILKRFGGRQRKAAFVKPATVVAVENDTRMEAVPVPPEPAEKVALPVATPMLPVVPVAAVEMSQEQKNEDCMTALLKGSVKKAGCDITLSSVNFDFDSAELDENSKEALRKVVETVNPNARYKLTASGHTDSKGPRKYNMGLSEKRAEEVRKYLMELGLSSDFIKIKGHGPDVPVADNDTEEGRALNRRVELNIIEVE